MGTFLHGLSTRFYYHSLDMSQYVEQVEQQLSRELVELRHLGTTDVGRLAGLTDVRLTLTGGALESANDSHVWDRLNEDTERVWAFLPSGDVFGRYAYCGLSLGDNQQRTAGNDVVRLPVALVSSAKVDRCVILRALAAGGTSPGATQTDTASSANGGAAYVICIATSSLTVTFQHSTDGTNWSTLVTMTALSAAGSEVKVVTGTVNKYLRVSWAGSGTWFAAFGRR